MSEKVIAVNETNKVIAVNETNKVIAVSGARGPQGDRGVTGAPGADGSPDVSTVTYSSSSIILGSSDFAKVIRLNSTSAQEILIPAMSTAFINKRIWIKKNNVGTVALNCTSGASIEGSTTIYNNSTSGTFSNLGLLCNATGSLILMGVLGPWST